MNDQVNIIELKEASSLAKIISSKTAQEMIKYIGENEKCTATQIKKDLGIPASTVHYNLKALTDSEIIDDSEFTYSSKGKQVSHYTLTNKILIIVPPKQNITAQLKAFIPGLLTVGGVVGLAFIIKMFTARSSGNVMKSSDLFAAPMMENSVSRIVTQSAELGIDNSITTSIPWYFSNGFFIGLALASVCLIGTYLLVKFIQKRRRTMSK